MMLDTVPDVSKVPLTNEYLVELAGYKPEEHPQNPYMVRDYFVKKYAWSIPTDEALKLVCEAVTEFKIDHLCSVGAGTGFWERLLAERLLAHVEAWDLNPPRSGGGENTYKHKVEYFPIQKCSSAAFAASRTTDTSMLFLSWPPYDDPMATEALKAFKGNVLVYVGEGFGGCTGDDEFHSIIGDPEEWEEHEVVYLPRWFGVNDRLTVYTRTPLRRR